MVIHKINFNVHFWADKSEKEFIDHEKHHFEGDPHADKKLKEAYSLLTQVIKASKQKKAVVQ